MSEFKNLDAAATVYFTRELEYVKQRTYDVKYPQYKATAMIPVSNEAGPAADSITYEQYDTVGMMKIIADYADDLPRSDVKGAEYTVQVKSLGGSYGYNIQDIRKGQLTGKSLPDKKAKAARRAYEQKVNNIAWFADGSASYGGMYGLLYHPNITNKTATTGAWAGGSTTAAQIITDFKTIIDAMRSDTKGVEEPDTFLLPPDEYGHLAITLVSGYTDTTVLTFLRNAYPGITFDWVNELADVNPTPAGVTSAKNVGVLYRRDPENLTLEIPQMFEQFGVQEKGLEYIVPTHARIAGVVIPYPLSVTTIEGI